jgi:hypothetical protein
MQFFCSLFFRLLQSMEVWPGATKVLTKEGAREVNNVESDLFFGKSKGGPNGIIGSCWSSDASISTD